MDPTPRHREYSEYCKARVKRYEGSRLCSFAPGDDRRANPSAPRETKRNIERTQECRPGFLAVREALVTLPLGVVVGAHDERLRGLAAAALRGWPPDSTASGRLFRALASTRA